MDKFAELLQHGAEVVGVQAARLWPQVVGVTFVRSVFFALVAVVVIVACLTALPYPIKAAKADMNDPRSDWGIAMMCVLAVCVLLATVVVATISLGDNLPGVFFPEAKTVLDIVKAVK